ncbi:MAG TPA: MBL fold metallo-hydrolase [Gemmatimonadaceae bacterium]|jgi:phosphoribosyl 1,2-cyclic phosphodiesterase|nr:MBL fold metallo-hydrolase [Gemmatimonadaceae bacterium]
MKLWILGSGSSGNSVLIETERSRILVDAGFSPRVLKQRLTRAGVAPDSIEAVVVTHEHTDHVKGVAAAARKWGWTIVSTAGTRMVCPEWSELRTILTPRKSSVVVGDFHLETVPVPHDANEPIAVIVTSIGEGARAGIVYDLGQVTDSISRALDKLDVLVIEANHDEGMLRAGPYPPSLQARIRGKFGHLSNGEAARLCGDSIHRGLNNIVLAHLSEKNNTPRTALETVGETLRRSRFRGRLTAASQDNVVGPISVGASGGTSAAPVQLALGI